MWRGDSRTPDGIVDFVHLALGLFGTNVGALVGVGEERVGRRWGRFCAGGRKRRATVREDRFFFCVIYRLCNKR